MKKVSKLKSNSKNFYGLLRLFIKTFIFLSLFTYLVFSLLLYFEDPPIEISSPKISLVDDKEGLLEVEKVNFANGGNFTDGFLRVSANKNAEIYLEESRTISNKNEAISIKNNMVYKGNGNQAVKVGYISQNPETEKKELKIAFNNNLNSEYFDSTSLNSSRIDGWIINNEPVKLGRDNIAGLNSPQVTDLPRGPLGEYRDVEEFSDLGIMKAEIRNRKENPQDKFLALTSKDVISKENYSLVRGPYIYKEKPVYLSKGDEIEFDWKACSAQDIYTVYAYLVDINTNHFQKLLNQNGSFHNMCVDWQKEKIKVKKDGQYIIVFTAGSIDYSGGKALGASLYLDNITFHKQSNMNIVTDDDLSRIAEKIRIKKEPTSQLKEIDLTFNVQNNRSKIGSLERKYIADEADEVEIFAANNESNKAFASHLFQGTDEEKIILKDNSNSLFSKLMTANFNAGSSNDVSNNTYERLAKEKYNFIAKLDLFITEVFNLYQRLYKTFKNSFITLAADRNNHNQQFIPVNESTNISTTSDFQDANEPQQNARTSLSTDNHLNRNVSESSKVYEKKNVNQEAEVYNDTEKGKTAVEIFNDNNGNGRRDSEDEKIGEVIKMKPDENKMYSDEQGNIHLYIERNKSKEISLSLKLDFEKLEELEKRSEDGSCSVIIRFE